ncbi:hypothetical protein ABZU32_16605 [Sphaerisporangium sp. NPDC005288]|uniref:hypothetical protein n=1 Tax=Sphaerisporangium sp. NPDC005288 TaxID=3155114 RepID=UPI0033BD26BA
MQWRSRLWWAAALVACGAGVAYGFTLSSGGFAWMGWWAFCPGRELYFSYGSLPWEVVAWAPLVRYSGAPLVVLAALGHWASIRWGRPRAGRVSGRAVGVLLLALYGTAPVGFAVDMAFDRACLDGWGGPQGAEALVLPDLAPTVAALCVLAAVRVPRHRVRRLVGTTLRARWFRRGVAACTVFGVLAFVPARDIEAGVVTTAEQCGSPSTMSTTPEVGERAFVCAYRGAGRLDDVADHHLVAYGRAMCAVYPRKDVMPYYIEPICPRAAADGEARRAAEEAEYQAEDAKNQKVCDASRHRPLVRPVRVARERTWTDYGVLESSETEASIDDDLLTIAQRDGLVASLPGHLMVLSHSDYDICLTAETYRRRPPVEGRGWDRVVEVGYDSPTGDIRLMDPMSGESDLPNLAFRGKGHYRVRVHYREPDWEAWTPQHILVMVYPAGGDQVVVHRPRSERG